MKKALISLLVIGSILAIPVASAQTVDAVTQQKIAAIQQLIETLTNLLNILLAQNTTSTPITTATSTSGITVNYTPQTSPLGAASIPTVTPSCVLNGVVEKSSNPSQSYQASFSWSLTGISTSTVGTLYQSRGSEGWFGAGSITSAKLNQGSFNNPIFNLRGNYSTGLWKAVFNDNGNQAICYAALPGYDNSNVSLGELISSTSTLPTWAN